MVLNYLGPDNGQGIKIFLDGKLKATDAEKNMNTYAQGNGKIVLGRKYTNADRFYASVDVDELLFFNQFLNADEISLLSNL